MGWIRPVLGNSLLNESSRIDFEFPGQLHLGHFFFWGFKRYFRFVVRGYIFGVFDFSWIVKLYLAWYVCMRSNGRAFKNIRGIFYFRFWWN